MERRELEKSRMACAFERSDVVCKVTQKSIECVAGASNSGEAARNEWRGNGDVRKMLLHKYSIIFFPPSLSTMKDEWLHNVSYYGVSCCCNAAVKMDIDAP